MPRRIIFQYPLAAVVLGLVSLAERANSPATDDIAMAVELDLIPVDRDGSLRTVTR